MPIKLVDKDIVQRLLISRKRMIIESLDFKLQAVAYIEVCIQRFSQEVEYWISVMRADIGNHTDIGLLHNEITWL